MKYIILFCTLLCVSGVKAQVTIGSHKIPETFSIFELADESGGLLLPRITTANRNLIDVSSASANGLLIYNKNTNLLNYWNGTTWVPSEIAITIQNGLKTLANGTVGLGGSLIKNTSINLNGKNLNFVTGSNYLNIDSNILRFTNDTVFSNPSKFAVSDILTITPGNVSMTPASGGKLTVTDASTTNTLSVQGSNTTITGTFNYNHGNPESGDVLVSDADGYAYWASLRPNTHYISGTLKTSATINGTTTPSEVSYVDITATSLDLPAGKWMIFADYAAISSNTDASNTYTRRYLWTALYSKPTGNPTASEVQETVAGASTSMGSNRRSFAQLFYVVDIAVPTSFYIKSGTRNRSVTLDSSLGDFNFYAISIFLPGE